MGLNFKVNGELTKAAWSYSGFMVFRKRLATSIGFELEEMEGFSDGGKYTRTWDEINDDLVPFLNHSDCEGELAPYDCMRVASRLNDILPGWPDDDYDKIMGKFLAAAMVKAANDGVPLIFS